MKNYIGALKARIEKDKAENEAIQKKIDELSGRIEDLESQKTVALTQKNNEEYLSLHRQMQELAGEKSSLKALLKAKQSMSVNKDEFEKAWNMTLDEFEKERKKGIREYQKAKESFAKLYLDLKSSENQMDKLRAEVMSLGGLYETSGRFPRVSEAEPRWRDAQRLFEHEIEALGITATDLIHGNY